MMYVLSMEDWARSISRTITGYSELAIEGRLTPAGVAMACKELDYFYARIIIEAVDKACDGTAIPR